MWSPLQLHLFVFIHFTLPFMRLSSEILVRVFFFHICFVTASNATDSPCDLIHDRDMEKMHLCGIKIEKNIAFIAHIARIEPPCGVFCVFASTGTGDN